MQSNPNQRRNIRRHLNTPTVPTETHALPRAKLLGGDTFQGGRPCGPGHAGRRTISWAQRERLREEEQARKALRVLFATALLLVAQIVGLLTHTPTTALAASGDDPMTVTFDGGTRHQLNGQEAYCCDPELTSPPEGTVLTHWSSGSAALDYVLYHAEGGPDARWGQRETRYVVWAVITGNTWYLDYYADGSLMTEGFSQRCHAFYDAAMGYQQNGGGGVEQGCARIYASPSYEYQNIVVCVPQCGELVLSKTSSLVGITKDSACYSLANAVYTVYADEGCSNAVATLRTDEAGSAGSVTLVKGAYWVKETAAPAGYALDESVYRVEVSASSRTEVTANGSAPSDTPLFARLPLLVQKGDAELSLKGSVNQAQGDATLAGAQFVLYRYDNTEGSTEGSATRSWTIETDVSGQATLDDQHLVSGDDPYRDADGTIVLPLGTYVLTESAPPTGYLLNTMASCLFTVTQEGSRAVITTLEGPSVGQAPTNNARFLITDDVIRGGVQLGKVDLQRGDHVAEGSAHLGGATFAIELTSDNPVVVGNTTYDRGSIVASIVTDDDGIAATSADALPYGSYVAYEVEAPEGYKLTPRDEWSVSFEIREDGAVVDLSDEESSVPDLVKRGDLSFVKVDGQSMRRLAGVPFVIESLTTGERHVVVTDENGYCSTEAAFNAHTYNTNGNDSLLDEDADDVALQANPDEGEEAALEEGQGELLAEEAPAEDPAEAGATPEETVVETTGDEVDTPAEGTADDPSLEGELGEDQGVEEQPAAHANNKEDKIALLSADTPAEDAPENDGAQVTLQAATVDQYAGVWFSGGTDREVAARDDLGALPYDRYRVSELRCASNEGFELVSFDVRVSRDLYVVDGGTVDDGALPVIQTTLATVSISDDGTWLLQDSVWYGNLVADGSQYELRGSLHLVGEDGSDAGVLTDSEGNEVTAQTTFTPSTTSGMEVVSFELDARELRGRTVVAFEQLWKDGELVAEHADIADEDQTAQVPDIGTTLTDEAGSKEVDGTAQVRLVDEVTYEGLVPQKAYQIVGTLMDKETGEMLRDGTGAPITAQTTFVPSESSGTAQVTFTFDGAPHRGKSIVAFESLRQNDLELAVHADITDEAQTVMVPGIGTTATDTADADHTLLAEEDAHIVDHVSYHGLIPGAQYVLTGHLVDRETGESLAHGVVSTTAELTFVPESSDGSVDIELSLNARALAGREVTVYERLQRDGADVASHEDLSSDDQSLSIPTIGTTATSTEGGKQISAAKDQAIVDTVSYQGLTPGREYLVTGTIHKRTPNGGDAGVLKNARGKEVTASATFTPETSSGSVKVSFLIDATSLDDTTLVAFEQLIDVETDALVAAHEDISDEGQSVRVTKTPKEAMRAEKKDSLARKLPQTGEELIPYGIMLGGASIAIALGTFFRKHDD